MKIDLDSTDGLPDGIKELATEGEGGKFSLDLTALVPAASVAGLKSALEKERGNAGAWAKLGKSPDEVAARIKELSEAKPKGKNDDDVAAMIEQATGPLTAQIKERDAMLAKMRSETTSATIKAELAKLGAMPEALDVVANFANSRIMFADNGTLQVMTADGKPMVGTGENHTATIGDLVKELSASMPFAFKDAGAGGGGKPPGANGGTPQPQITRTQFDAMSQLQRSEFSKSGGKVTD